MKNQVKTIITTFIFCLITSNHVFAQYTCQSDGGTYLAQLVGSWEVVTKDRTSPGNYESNTGLSAITSAIEGCGIHESYEGSFKNKDYARQVIIIAQDARTIEMTGVDSEHGSFSTYKGSISSNEATMLWYRDENVKRLQSKYILTIHSSNQFELSSYLSTDTGNTWALTHERKYSRVIQN